MATNPTMLPDFDDRSPLQEGDLAFAYAPHPTDSELIIVRYSGQLPTGSGTGNCTRTLRVEELVEDHCETTSRAVVLT